MALVRPFPGSPVKKWQNLWVPRNPGWKTLPKMHFPIFSIFNFDWRNVFDVECQKIDEIESKRLGWNRSVGSKNFWVAVCKWQIFSCGPLHYMAALFWVSFFQQRAIFSQLLHALDQKKISTKQLKDLGGLIFGKHRNR